MCDRDIANFPKETNPSSYAAAYSLNSVVTVTSLAWKPANGLLDCDVLADCGFSPNPS